MPDTHNSLVRANGLPEMTLRCPYCSQLLTIDLSRLEGRDVVSSDHDYSPRTSDIRCPQCSVALWQFPSVTILARELLGLSDRHLQAVLYAVNVGRALFERKTLEIDESLPDDLGVLAPDASIFTDDRKSTARSQRIGLLRIEKDAARIVLEEYSLHHLASELEFYLDVLDLTCKSVTRFVAVILSERKMTDWLRKYCDFDPKHVVGTP